MRVFDGLGMVGAVVVDVLDFRQNEGLRCDVHFRPIQDTWQTGAMMVMVVFYAVLWRMAGCESFCGDLEQKQGQNNKHLERERR